MLRLLLLFLPVLGVLTQEGGICDEPYVELLVSPVVEDGFMRRITYQWERLPENALIVIYDENPAKDGVEAILRIPVATPNGWGNTTFEEGHVNIQNFDFLPRCVSYYIAYTTGDENYKGLNCLKTEPNWMENLYSRINQKKLKELFIPGTHDSSAYKEYNFDRPDDLIMKHSVTQDEPILTQLMYGARYIDLRVGYYPNNQQNVWWGNHGILQFHPMHEIFENVTYFLNNTREIVILDVQEFPVGFGDDYTIHKMFIDYLYETFKGYIVVEDTHWDTYVKNVFSNSTHGTLIISYDNAEMVQEYDFLWPAVTQVWGDKQHKEDLMEFLTERVTSPPNAMWAAMAQLTPSATDIVLNTMKGLRHAAEEVNHDVTNAFRTSAWAKNANVVAMDFIRGSGIISAAIQWNTGLSSQCGGVPESA